jgi:hypothetical protein
MSMAPREAMTLDEFLVWERRQELRYEFDGFEPVAMTGGTLNHAAIADNAVDALRRQMKGPCRVFRARSKSSSRDGCAILMSL